MSMNQLHKFLWIFVITIGSGGRIIDSKLWNLHRPVWNQMNELIKLCFSEQNHPIVITADLVDEVFGTSQEFDLSNLIIIDHNYKFQVIQSFNPAYPTYILSADSADELVALLHELKSSPTWSITSVHFIIETNGKFCTNASKMLQILWKMDLITSFYACYESDDKEIMMLYTYNPFTNRAPEPWIEVESTDKPDNRWTLYKRAYTNDKQICKNLIFDKTKFLDGYTVKATGETNLNYTKNKSYNISSFKYYSTYHFQFMFFDSLFSKLNVTPIFYYDEPGLVINNTVTGFMNTIINGTTDIALNARYLSDYEQFEMMKLDREINYLILTQPVNLDSIVMNYDSFLNPTIIGIAVFILLITFVILTLNNNCDYGAGFLDAVQLSISRGIDTPFDKLSTCIIFLTSTLFIFLMSPAIQGQIFSNSAVQVRHYPQTLKDLYDFKFKVYYYHLLKDHIIEQHLWQSDDKNLHPITTLPTYCAQQVLNDSFSACITIATYQYQSIEQYYENRFHLAETKLYKKFVSFPMKKNWALKNKVEKLVMNFEQSGFCDLWNRQEYQTVLKKLKRDNMQQSLGEFSEINFENFITLYIFFILSYFFGILVFLAELAIEKFKAKRHRRIIIRTLEKRVKFVGNRLILIK